MKSYIILKDDDAKLDSTYHTLEKVASVAKEWSKIYPESSIYIAEIRLIGRFNARYPVYTPISSDLSDKLS